MPTDILSMSNRTDLVIVVNVILSFTTLGSLALRFAKVTGNAKQRKFDAQNLMICLAGFSGVMMSILQCVATKYGLGHHSWDVPSSQLVMFYKLYVAIFCFYLACNMFVKFALLFFYRHTTYEPWHHWSIWIMQFVAFAFGVSSIIVIIFQCVPIAMLWDHDLSGSCIDIKTFFYCNAIIMIVNDIILYLLPIIFTWKLQLRLPQRIVLNMLFALGALVIAASCVRLYVIYRYDQEGDLPWNIASCLLWSAVENHVAIFISCAPSIKAVVSGVLYPLVSTQFSSIKGKIKKTRGSEGGSSTHKSPSLTLATIGSGPSRLARRARDPFATTRRDSFNTLDSGFEYVNRSHGHHEMDPIARANSDATLADTYRKGSDASTDSTSKEPQIMVYSIDEADSPTQLHHMTLDSSQSPRKDSTT